MRALVTGANGFVGAAVVRRLLEEGHAVRALVRAASDRRNLRGLPVELREGDLREPASLDAALGGCEALFHVAADYRLWARHPEELYQNNVDGSRNVMLAALRAGVGRVVYTSSVATLRLRADATPADERDEAQLDDMVGHYKRSKFLAEREILRLHLERGLPVVVVNPSTPIGPGDVRPTPTGRIVLDAAAGRMPAYVDTGLNVVHVDDVAAGHLLAYSAGTPGRRYVLGGEDLSLRDILAEVARVTGGRAPRVRLPTALVWPIAWFAELGARLGFTDAPLATLDGVRMARKRMYFSSERARAELGYAPRPAQEAIADAVAWFRANGYLGP